MEYFWKHYSDLPAGVGYEHFSAPHLVTLFVIAALVAVFAAWFRQGCEPDAGSRFQRGCGPDAGSQLQRCAGSGGAKSLRDRVLVAIPWIMVGLECFKDGFLIYVHHFGVGYLPLHLCGIGVFVFLLEAHAKSIRWQTVFSEISVTLILPGAVAALLFPDWTTLYPPLNFMSLYGFTWHGLLLLYPVLLAMAGRVHLSVRHIHYDLLFLVCAAVPVYVFDCIFSCNYMFLIRPPAGSPLAWIAGITGDEYYLAGYAAFCLIVIGLIYLGVCIFNVQRSRVQM